MTLRAQLSRVKDKLPTSMSSCVVYGIPCSCGKVYIGEENQQDACRKGEEKKSAVAEHAWKDHHPIRWQETSVQRVWRIEGEGGTAYPSNTRGSALQPGCWTGAAWLLGFHYQGFVCPTTICLIGKGFSLFFFSMNELHGFFGGFSSCAGQNQSCITHYVIYQSLYKPPHHVSFLVEFCITDPEEGLSSRPKRRDG